MAKFEDAINFVLAHEVKGWPKNAADLAIGMGAVKSLMPINAWFTEDPADRGGATAWGITLQTASKFGVGDVAGLFAVKPEVVEAIYKSFWKFDQIEDQNIATKYLDLAVNMGMLAATRVVQAALGNVEIDGAFGKKTLAAINGTCPGVLMARIVMHAESRYREIVCKNPSQQRFLSGWVNRARALP